MTYLTRFKLLNLHDFKCISITVFTCIKETFVGFYRISDEYDHIKKRVWFAVCLLRFVPKILAQVDVRAPLNLSKLVFIVFIMCSVVVKY